jgi:ectoine hydroxylase-related dioxygenase (phytanoyl-CoA dioxygenase family)
LGLSPHCDAGSVERWIDKGYQAVYEKIFADNFKEYDPFDAAYRNKTKEIESPAVSHVFRTFQGWVALTEQGPGDGTLQLIPIAKSMAYILTRALLDDVDEKDLCSSMPARALSVNSKYHSLLLRGLVSIPKMNPGDTVWWHPDVVHAVEDHHTGKGYSNVVYVGSTPYCEKNLVYAKKQSQKFLQGKSPPDFAAEDYEVAYKNRATIKDLTPLGKKQLAL